MSTGAHGIVLHTGLELAVMLSQESHKLLDDLAKMARIFLTSLAEHLKLA